MNRIAIGNNADGRPIYLTPEMRQGTHMHVIGGSGKGKSKRSEIFYFDDRGSLNAVRINDWKVHFAIGDRWFGGTMAFPQNFPRVTNLRMDPYEDVIANMDHMPMYFRWAADKLWIYQPLQSFVARFLGSFREFPQRQASASFNIGEVLKKMETSAPTGR